VRGAGIWLYRSVDGASYACIYVMRAYRAVKPPQPCKHICTHNLPLLVGACRFSSLPTAQTSGCHSLPPTLYPPFPTPRFDGSGHGSGRRSA
jgi:hypothetical protein